MHQTILTALVVVSILLIVLVAMQPTQTNASSSLNGGAERLFSMRKARGLRINSYVTPRSLLGTLFLILTLYDCIRFKLKQGRCLDGK